LAAETIPGAQGMSVFDKIMAHKKDWLPGVLFVVVVLIGLMFLAGGPSIVFKYVF
jgi:hypothetical protein